jgi:DNA topoisomerase-1
MRLRRADCSSPGIVRRRAGRGFVYVDAATGERVADDDTLDRIRSLAVPPAWSDVWICPWPNGHLQAVGVDARGRKQYLYHVDWRARRDTEKFDHMLDFAACLPTLRARLADLLDPSGGLGRDRVLACAVRLLDLGFFRIGTEGYAEENQTYGLATIRKKHVTMGPDGMVTFDYTAKSGKRRIQSIVDPAVCEVVSALKERSGGGYELLAWWDDGAGAWRDVKSADINAFVKELTGGDFTAKDFRTWNATVLCAVALAVSEAVASSRTGRQRAVVRAVKEVSHYLGNTPAVCRSSYIDPRVIDRYAAGVTIGPVLAKLGDGAGFGALATQGAVEAAVLDLLSDAPPATASGTAAA